MLESLMEWIEGQVEKKQTLDYCFEPAFGAVIYTDVLFGFAEHSGIYVGERKVVSLQHDGSIAKSSLATFTNNLTTLQGDIYVPCTPLDWSIGSYNAGIRALDMVGERREYNLILDNCHQFSAGCLTGDFENANNFLWMLKDEVRKHHNERVIWKKWRV